MKKLIFVVFTIFFSTIGLSTTAEIFSASNSKLLCLDSSDKGGDSGNHRG